MNLENKENVEKTAKIESLYLWVKNLKSMSFRFKAEQRKFPDGSSKFLQPLVFTKSIFEHDPFCG